MKISKLLQPRSLLFLFVFLNLVIGLLIVPDYGRVGDEDYKELKSELAFQIYSGSFTQLLGETYEDLGTSQFYGIAISLPLHLIEHIFTPTLNPLKREVAHFGYFAVFQIAVISLYFLSNNFFLILGSACLSRSYLAPNRSYSDMGLSIQKICL